MPILETYEYDYLGNRTAKTTNGATTEYTTDLSSGYSQVLKAETDTSTVYYTRGFKLISRREVSTASYYIYDGGFSVRALTNEAGTVTDTLVFDAFGNKTEHTGTTDNSYGFQGEEQDATGLYYLRARYMDPATGTFTTMDTYGGSLSDPMSLHKYLFANSNPVMYSDPSGHSASLQELGASMAIGSILAGAAYSTCAIIAAIIDATTGSNRLSKYSIQGLVRSMVYGALLAGIGWELGVFFQSLLWSFLQYIGLSIFCALFGIDLKIWAYFESKDDHILWSTILSTLGDVAFLASGAAAGAAITSKNNPLGQHNNCGNNTSANNDETLTVSAKKMKHVQNNHNPHKVAEQLMHGGTYDETSTYFNKNWSNQEIEDAVNFAYNYAVNMGFTDGTSSVMYNGELITVYIENGQFKTAYGNYVYSYAELLGLIGGN